MAATCGRNLQLPPRLPLNRLGRQPRRFLTHRKVLTTARGDRRASFASARTNSPPPSDGHLCAEQLKIPPLPCPPRRLAGANAGWLHQAIANSLTSANSR